jgi:hypothetical protein
MWTQEYRNPNDKPAFMNTLTSCVNKVTKDGYTDNFKVTKEGLYSSSKEKHFKPEEVQVINFYRFEGQSDPADNAIMYVIETNDGQKGILIDAYGPYSDEQVNAFMTAVEDINKKVDKSDKSGSQYTA